MVLQMGLLVDCFCRFCLVGRVGIVGLWWFFARVCGFVGFLVVCLVSGWFGWILFGIGF